VRAQKRKAALISMGAWFQARFYFVPRAPSSKVASLLKVEAHCPQPERLAPRLLSTLIAEQVARTITNPQGHSIVGSSFLPLGILACGGML
jgi:hypothetical protein